MKRSIVWALSAIVGFVACLVLFGWFYNIQVLKTIVPNYITMKPNTAVGLLGLAIALGTSRSKGLVHSWVCYICCLFVISLGLATFSQYLFSVSWGIDDFLFPGADYGFGIFPVARMAPITSLNLTCLGLSILVTKVPKIGEELSQFFAVLALFAAFQSLVGYTIGLTYQFGSAFYTQMALHTSASMFLLGVGILSLTSRRGLLSTFHTKSPTAKLVKWMLITVAIVPTMVRWTGRVAYERGILDQDGLLLLSAFGTTLLLAVVIVVLGSALLKAERINQDVYEEK